MRERILGGATISGRQLHAEGYNPERLGEVGPLKRAHKNVVEFVRRHCDEIEEKQLLRQDDGRFLHRKSGDLYEVVTEFVDWPLEPEDRAGVMAFTVRGGYIVPLRLAGRVSWVKSLLLGAAPSGRRAGADDPMPTPRKDDRFVIWC
jgi:hypothetical protein